MSDEPKFMTKAQVRSWLKRVQKHKDAIAKHRDALRDLVTEIDMIADNADEAQEGLERAIDVLSEHL